MNHTLKALTNGSSCLVLLLSRFTNDADMLKQKGLMSIAGYFDLCTCL